MLIENPLSPKWGIAINGLNEADLKRVCDCTTAIEYGSREHLFFEGDAADHILILRSGRVRLFQAREDGHEFSYGIFFNGTILNLAAFVSGRSAVLSAETLEPVTLARMNRAGFEHCLDKIPRFRQNVMTLLAILALDSIEKNTPMALDKAGARLGRTLLNLAKPAYGCAGEADLIANVSQEELGRLIGASRAWVGQTLSDFESLGLIHKSRNRLQLVDRSAMERYIANLEH